MNGMIWNRTTVQRKNIVIHLVWFRKNQMLDVSSTESYSSYLFGFSCTCAFVISVMFVFITELIRSVLLWKLLEKHHK